MSDEAGSLSKWKVILAVGVGVAAVVGVSGLAYVALSSRRASRAEASNGRMTVVPETGEATANDKNSGGAATVVKSDYEKALEIKLKGNDFYKQQKYGDAVRCYQEAIAVCPADKKDDMSKFHQNIAAVYVVMADNAEDPAEKDRLLHLVLEHCSHALKHNNRYIKALARRLKAYESLGMKKEALLDVTRIVIIDETQGTQQAETITGILKDLGKDQAVVEFPKLGPLAPTKHLIKTFSESFVWQDDLSEGRLKELWDEHAKMTGESQQLLAEEEAADSAKEETMEDKDEGEDGSKEETTEDKQEGADGAKEETTEDKEEGEDGSKEETTEDKQEGADGAKEETTEDKEEGVDGSKEETTENTEEGANGAKEETTEGKEEGADGDKEETTVDKEEGANGAKEETTEGKEEGADGDKEETTVDKVEGADGVKEETTADKEEGEDAKQELLPELPQSESVGESRGSNADFYEDPFVQAAAMFREKIYHGILEVITDAVEKGCPVFLPHALVLRATFYILWRENSKALADLDTVINMQGVPDMLVINALIKKSTVYAGQPDMAKVKACFDKCLTISDCCPDVLIHRARMMLESPEDPKSMETVIEDLKKALELEPLSAYAMFSLGTAYHRVASIMQSAQMLSMATSTFEEASKKFPTFVDGLVLYAMCLQDTNQVSKSLALLTKAAKMEPENPTVHLSLGVLSLVSQSDAVKAVAYMKKAISVDNSCIQAYDTLASVEIQKGNSEQALDYYNKATRFSRSQVEMGQVLVAREVIAAQQQVCKEYGLSVKELISRVMPTPMF